MNTLDTLNARDEAARDTYLRACSTHDRLTLAAQKNPNPDTAWLESEAEREVAEAQARWDAASAALNAEERRLYQAGLAKPEKVVDRELYSLTQ